MIRVFRGPKMLLIPELSDEEAERLEILGEAQGSTELHCVYIGARHAKKFFERVAGYQRAPSTRPDLPVHLIFYEKSGMKDWTPSGKARRRRRTRETP